MQDTGRFRFPGSGFRDPRFGIRFPGFGIHDSGCGLWIPSSGHPTVASYWGAFFCERGTPVWVVDLHFGREGLRDGTLSVLLEWRHLHGHLL